MPYSNLQFMMPLRAGLALIAAAAFADTYPRQTGVDVQHYTFRVSLSDTSDEISGETTVELLFVQNGVDRLALDLTNVADGKGMIVDAVVSPTGPVNYSHGGNRLTISLPAPSKSGERRRFTVRYHGVP